MSICLAPARAAASRRNGARSHGPKTPTGKARSAQNALKHGLRAQEFAVGDEDAEAFAALESALVDELAPDGALQGLLARRIARAAWRLERAERIEAELMDLRLGGDGDLGLALVRDGGTRSLDTLLRYRGAAMAELWRALRLLKALQAEAPGAVLRDAAPCAIPNEPEGRTNPGEIARIRTGGAPRPDSPCAQPNEPETRGNPGEIVAPADEPGAGGDAKMRRPVALMRHPASRTKASMPPGRR